MAESLAPVKIGVLDDTPSPGMNRETFDRVARLAFGDVSRRFARPVEFVFERVDGLPWGSAKALEDGYRALVDAGVIAIIGPAMGDDATVATELADRAEMPTINWAGTERGRSDFMFHLQIGSHEDEPLLLARYLVDHSLRNVAVVVARAVIGQRYGRFFEEACDALEIDISTRLSSTPGETDFGPTLTALEKSNADAIVFLGLGHTHPPIAEGLRALGHPGPWLTNSYGMFGWTSPESAAALDGWIYVDQVSDRNPAFRSVAERLGVSLEKGPICVFFLVELLRLIAEGLARAPELTRRGVRDGLERIKPLPSALGAPGTFAGFGRFERGALKGPYLVLRRWQDGRSLEVD